MDIKTILTDLRAERDRIDQAIAAMEALNGTSARKAAKPASGTKPTTSKRVVSPEARQRMAEAQQKRWAKKRRAVKAAAKKAAAPAPVATKSAKAASKKTAPTKAKGGITAAGRKRMAEAAKASWAARKKTAKAAAKKVAAPAPVATAAVKEKA
jgi:hypothetical protein